MSGLSKRQNIVFLAAVLIVIGVLATTTTAMTMSSPAPVHVPATSVTRQGAMSAYATFQGIAIYDVIAECPRLNITNQCLLTVSLSLNTTGPYPNLYTKSITLKLTNGGNSVMAVGFNTFTNPAQEYRIGYGYQPPSSRYVVVEPSFIGHGDTWTFTVNLGNPPTVNGNAFLSIAPEAIVAQDTFQGKTFDLQATIQLPGP